MWPLFWDGHIPEGVARWTPTAVGGGNMMATRLGIGIGIAAAGGIAATATLYAALKAEKVLAS